MFCPRIARTFGIILVISFSLVIFTVKGQDDCTQYKKCFECITGGVTCAWCDDTNTTFHRCNTKDQLSNCESVQNPLSTTAASTDDPFNANKQDTIQLKPQHVKVELRKGDTQIVNIIYRKTIEYPLDLYYVMDLSYSMKDDLEKLQGLGKRLLGDIRTNVTDNAHMGFGTFVDKVLMPYTSTVEEQMKNPCMKTENNETCSPPFGFRHQLNLTANETLVQEVVSQTKVSGNIDTPEGGFDALMQVAVCEEMLQWRRESLKVILYSTDESPHIALDGKLAAILEANDMECHLKQNAHPYLAEETWTYAESKRQDYPSIGQLREAFDRHNIQPIFAVTENVRDIYQEINKLIPLSEVDTLAADSGNVIDIIKKSYLALKDKIRIEPPKIVDKKTGLESTNTEFKYRTKCPGADFVENELKCEKASLGEEVIFQFELTAIECPTDPTQTDVIKIATDSLLNEVTIEISYLCECDCAANAIPDSQVCSANGTYTCGVCHCNQGWVGRQCHCEDDNRGVSLEESCKVETDKEICSGNGFCECGVCECDSEGGFYGEFCECSNVGCRVGGVNGLTCGGTSQGICRNCNNNQECVCIKPWTKRDRTKLESVCECNDEICIATNQTVVCNDHGTCDCNECKCGPKYRGTYCEECQHPECSVLHQENMCENTWMKECALCTNKNRDSANALDKCNYVCQNITMIHVDNFKTLPDCDPNGAHVKDFCTTGNNDANTECTICKSISETSDLFEPPKEDCTTFDDFSCTVTYRVYYSMSQTEYALMVQELDRKRDCPQPVSSYVIVGAVIGGIVLVGLILLIVWKIFQIAADKRDYKKFLEEEKSRNWTQGQNPLFSKASVRIENPAFIGK